MVSHPPPPVALTIAGSDSSGGAGIQADLKTFHQWRVYGSTALTAVTAQNTMGVQEVHPLPRAIVAAQIDSVASDMFPKAVKTGMLADSGIVRAVAAALRRHRLDNYVLDPVMVATSGDRLLAPAAVEAVRDRLVPRAAIVTPNLPEAMILTGVRDRSLDGMDEAARILVAAGAGAAVVKGGHLEGDEVADIFWDGSSRRVFRSPRRQTRHTHGTGCTLSAAIAAGLAHGTPLEEAVAAAIAWVREAIAGAPGLGAGRGPINHFADVASTGSSASISTPSTPPAVSP